MRNLLRFNDNWLFFKAAEVPASLPIGWKRVNLPHTWNAVAGQDGGNDYWRGTAMYCKKFAKPDHCGAIVLEFLGAAMTTDVYLNGEHLTHHESGYSTFRADITDHLQEANLLCVAVDNSNNDWENTISQMRELITQCYKLEDIQEAYHLFENKLDGVIKVAIEP